MGKHVRFDLLLGKKEKEALKLLALDEGGKSQAAVIRQLIWKEAAVRGLYSHTRISEDDVSKVDH